MGRNKIGDNKKQNNFINNSGRVAKSKPSKKRYEDDSDYKLSKSKFNDIYNEFPDLQSKKGDKNINSDNIIRQDDVKNRIQRELAYVNFLAKNIREYFYKKVEIYDNENIEIKYEIICVKDNANEKFDQNYRNTKDSNPLSKIKKTFYVISEIEKYIKQYHVFLKKNINDFKDDTEYHDFMYENTHNKVSEELNDILNAELLLEKYLEMNFDLPQHEIEEMKAQCISKLAEKSM